MTGKDDDRPERETPAPQHQTNEDHGTIKQPQRDRHNAEHTKRGSEGDRRRASNMPR